MSDKMEDFTRFVELNSAQALPKKWVQLPIAGRARGTVVVRFHTRNGDVRLGGRQTCLRHIFETGLAACDRLRLGSDTSEPWGAGVEAFQLFGG